VRSSSIERRASYSSTSLGSSFKSSRFAPVVEVEGALVLLAAAGARVRHVHVEVERLELLAECHQLVAGVALVELFAVLSGGAAAP
jgi:hypothetical protein